MGFIKARKPGPRVRRGLARMPRQPCQAVECRSALEASVGAPPGLSSLDPSESNRFLEIAEDRLPPDAVAGKVVVGHGKRAVARPAVRQMLVDNAEHDLEGAATQRGEGRRLDHVSREPNPRLL